jgi:hypothetical protein
LFLATPSRSPQECELLRLTLQDIELISDQQLDRLFREKLLPEPEPGEKHKTLELFFSTMEKKQRREV